jgi:hypothetical protein
MSAIHSLSDLLCPNHAQNKIQYLEKARQFMSRFSLSKSGLPGKSSGRPQSIKDT